MSKPHVETKTKVTTIKKKSLVVTREMLEQFLHQEGLYIPANARMTVSVPGVGTGPIATLS